MAAKPVFCTELSELNSKRSEFPSLVMTGGRRDPQNKPCFLTSPEPILDESARLSYSQSCWKNKTQLVLKSLLSCTVCTRIHICTYNFMNNLTPLWLHKKRRRKCYKLWLLLGQLEIHPFWEGLFFFLFYQQFQEKTHMFWFFIVEKAKLWCRKTNGRKGNF